MGTHPIFRILQEERRRKRRRDKHVQVAAVKGNEGKGESIKGIARRLELFYHGLDEEIVVLRKNDNAFLHEDIAEKTGVP
jgi:hypothetical protein